MGQVSEGDGGRDVGGSGHLGGGPHRGHQRSPDRRNRRTDESVEQVWNILRSCSFSESYELLKAKSLSSEVQNTSHCFHEQCFLKY